MFASSENNILDGIGKKYPGVARVRYIRILHLFASCEWQLQKGQN